MADKGGSLLEGVGRLLAPQTTQGFLNAPLERQQRAQLMGQGDALSKFIAALPDAIQGNMPAQTLAPIGNAPAMELPPMKLSTQTVTPGGVSGLDRTNADLRALAMKADPAGTLASFQSLFTPQVKTVNAGDTIGVYTPGKGFAPSYTAPKNDEMTPWQKAQLQNQDRQFNIQIGKMDAAEAARNAAEAARNRPQATAYVSRITGNPIRLDPTTQTYMDEGNAVQAADLVPAADFNKDAEAARNIIGDISNAENIKKMVNENPSAFDQKKVNEARLKRQTGNVIGLGNQWAAGVFTPEENKVRATVAQESAAIINKLYGAALSAGEDKRAQAFAPDPNGDDLETLLPKVEAAMTWANSKKGSIIPGAIKAAERQLGRSANPQQSQIPKNPTLTNDASGKAVYDALPKGASYIDPTGKPRIKQ